MCTLSCRRAGRPLRTGQCLVAGPGGLHFSQSLWARTMRCLLRALWQLEATPPGLPWALLINGHTWESVPKGSVTNSRGLPLPCPGQAHSTAQPSFTSAACLFIF